MIRVFNGHFIHSLDNNDEKIIHCTASDRKEIEELAGKEITKLSTEEIKSYLRFIRGYDS